MTTNKTARTRNLIGRVERLCALLLEEDMTQGEIADDMCVSKSAVRNYLASAKAAGLISVVGTRCFGNKGQLHEILRIKRDQPAIDAMMNELRESKNPTATINRIKATKKVNKMKQDKARKVHTLYDKPSSVKMAPFKAPGRHYLDRALFGDGPARGVAA